jgi:hypothetical protein
MRSVLLPVGAILLALLLFGLIVAFAGVSPVEVWVLVAVTALSLTGSTLHVKSLIRERRDPRFSRASQAFALLSVVAAGALAMAWGLPSGWWLVAPFVLLAVRRSSSDADRASRWSSASWSSPASCWSGSVRCWRRWRSRWNAHAAGGRHAASIYLLSATIRRQLVDGFSRPTAMATGHVVA